MSMRRIYNLIRTIVQARLAEIAASIQETPWAQAIRNVRQAWRHRSSTAVARAMLQRYPHCYLVNADFMGFPGIELAEYRTCSTDDVPLVRVSQADGAELMTDRAARPIRFLDLGATLIPGDGESPFPPATAIIEAIEAEGWHILTVDDARRIVEGRDMARSVGACLSTRNTWLTMVENAADRIGIADSLFPFCEQVIATRAAIIVVYTPGLPRPLRLWRLSMNWIMPPLPPVA
ncbi:hypothetical protein [Bradyrhizobium liaoningense]|uniref:hypothetical protein n=1 Tax=Bradyrhizobium liaoningense TaxID=43992 RepID=UPI001BA85088|nr:hypothetical protein [Bradyrhizobium liaoningense]MBR0818893.1 hypothetical protein [Bradyrhizobium liaoningense]